MMGKAVVAFIPSSATRIMQGAKRPMPRVMSAPSTKLPATAMASRAPESPSAWPPPGASPVVRATMIPTASKRSTPIPS